MATIDYKQKIKDYMNSSEVDTLYKSILNNLFPELKESEESEDEEIRRGLIRAFQSLNTIDVWNGIKRSAILEWLEKQGGQKSIDSLTQQEAMDIAVAKCFEQGELKLGTDFSDLRTWKYIVDAVWTEKEGIGQYLDSPFTEEVAKKLQKRFGNIEQILANSCKTCKNGQKPSMEGVFVNVDEVREDFMQEVYRVLNADPTNDRANQIIDAFDHLPTITIQKPSDKVKSNLLTHERAMKMSPFMRSGFENEPASWSEGDETLLNNLIYALANDRIENDRDEYVSWLKSLKDRYTWKPSEEQMEALKKACDEHFDIDGGALWHLYEDLKKLREE